MALNRATTTAPGAAAQPALAGTVTLAVGSSTVPVQVTGTTTVLAVMQHAASTTPFTFEASYYPSMGYFVTSIGGVPSTGSTYWTYTINGAPAEAGLSQQPVAPGDTITWALGE